ncbi:MAG: WG repeat-containing protein, partial [Bacteroidota bacterium]
MYTKLYLSLLLVYCGFPVLQGQKVFPVKRTGSWGLINDRGQLLTQTDYDLIGNPDEYGYLVAQRNDFLGLIGSAGKVILPIVYQDIQVLDAGIIAVLENNSWRIVDLNGRTLLNNNYQQLRPLGDGLLAYRADFGWGVIREDGKEIISPAYEDIKRLKRGFFRTMSRGKYGLINLVGNTILEPVADEIRFDTSGIILYSTQAKWGGVSRNGNILFSPRYVSYVQLGDNYLLLTDDLSRQSVYTQSCNRIFSITDGAEVLQFSENYLGLKLNGKIGLLNRCGELVLSPIYQEIQPFSTALFRTKKEREWGLSAGGDQQVLPEVYAYISPLDYKVASIKIGSKFGFINYRGEVLQDPQFDRVETFPRSVKAYLGTGNGAFLNTFTIDEAGNLGATGSSSEHFQIRIGGAAASKGIDKEKYTEISKRLLPKYEWFYEVSAGRWGLRSRQDGRVVLAPTFTEVEVLPEFGFTLVGLPK